MGAIRYVPNLIRGYKNVERNNHHPNPDPDRDPDPDPDPDGIEFLQIFRP